MTIRELSDKLQLSKTTISLALRDSALVKESTREWVKRRAAELGYTMNPVASAFLQQVRSRGTVRYRANLALLVEPYGPSLPLIALFRGMSERGRKLGYTVDEIDAAQHDADSLTRVLIARGVLGVIIGPMVDDKDHVALDWSKFAVIAFGYSLARPGLHRVVPDHAQALRSAFWNCRAKGYRRVGLALMDLSDARSNGLWSSCFLGLQKKLPESERVEPFLVPQKEYTTSNLRKWLRQEKPDAVIFHYQRLILQHAEIFRGPFAKIFPVVLDRLPNDSAAGIDQQYDRCGVQLTDLLSLQILHNERGVPTHPSITMLDGMWVDGNLSFR